MEAIWWLFVFVAWAVWLTSEGEEMPVKTWYVIYKVWRVNGSLQFNAVDAIECECTMDALTYAKQRFRTKYGESLRADACLTEAHIERAKSIANQHRLDDQVAIWTDGDWSEFESLPTYSGDQDKYTKTQAS